MKFSFPACCAALAPFCLSTVLWAQVATNPLRPAAFLYDALGRSTPGMMQPRPMIPPPPLPDEYGAPPRLDRLPSNFPGELNGLSLENLSPETSGSEVAFDRVESAYAPTHGQVVSPSGHPLGWQVHGWVNGGETYNLDDPASRFNGPVTFNDRSEGLGNQLYLFAERPVLGNACGLDLGGRVDLIWGSDYLFTEAQGLETRPDGRPHWNSHFYGLAIPQFYVEAGTSHATITAGHFYSPLGFERFQAPLNFFYSHSYSFQYGRPMTLTGAIGTVLTDSGWTLYGGAVNGWDRFDGVEDRVSYLSGCRYEACDGSMTFAAAAIRGHEPGDLPTLCGTRTTWNAWACFNVCCNLSYVAEGIGGWQENALPGRTAEWYGVSNYLFYRLNDCWSFGVRGEWFRDDDGVRVQGPRPGNTQNGDGAGNFYEITAGINWSPTCRIVVRPEVRFDWFDGVTLPANRSPFADGTQNSQVLVALDAYLTF